MIIVNNPGMSMDACIPQEMMINDVSLAHAYVPFQKLCTTFAPLTALTKGTIFPPLTNMYTWDKKGRVDWDE